MSDELQELKKSIGELKKEQNKLVVEALKQVAGELRLKATDQKIDELRRAIEDLKRRPATAPIPLPMPLPAPRVRPELPQPQPQPGKVQLEVPADAVVFVNGKPISASSPFLTPPLEGGKDYVFNFEVTIVRDGKNLTRIKRVPLRAGATVRLSYEKMDAGDRWTQAEKAGPSAYLTIRLPADARLKVDDVDCPLTSATRAFATPSLVPGREYYYVLEAQVVREGRPITQTRRVTFRPGERITVSFDNLGSSSLTAR